MSLPTLSDDELRVPGRDGELRTILRAVPVIYDLLRSTYGAWLARDPQNVDSLVRLHGALIIISLADLPEEEQRPVSRRLVALMRESGLTAQHIRQLDAAVALELMAVVRAQNRCSQRRQRHLAAVIAARLGAMDSRATAAAA
ncbi:hypothetical protein IMF23_06285 [Chelatococcus daeguensis]|uniref:Uncharacterized protein n=1 Tax=Chelatococcus sambhunathii TaxID=363953 RepID=A0ABM9U5P3_9HYPH|nr:MULTISPECIES: hypothetical protein [Chelatococcus]KZE35033.1 hypothetical protein AVW15_15340 [Chelatococcus daeguensis]MBM3083036.1 hypothetical protein [Chelatococcus daeguensis]CUA88897.1 hypothetical protein Ga0061061_105289 [Chelatococcus sambhunathii]